MFYDFLLRLFPQLRERAYNELFIDMIKNKDDCLFLYEDINGELFEVTVTRKNVDSEPRT